jgi:hypothetical protein
VLLRETDFRRADLATLWNNGVRAVAVGGSHPFDIRWDAGASAYLPLAEVFRTPVTPRGTLLVAGLGSLGSVAAELLVGHAASFVLADPDTVAAANPVRQAYNLADRGRPKALALREGLLAAGADAVFAYTEALADEGRVVELMKRHDISAGLVVTGTAADFAIARALRDLGVPHVVGRCYPRARYWEAIVVDGARGLALDEIRGQIVPGPAPAPTPEQLAAYSDAGALEAEPATLVESGWAAAWLARLAAQLLAPAGMRERWLLELLATGRTCLVGGVGVEQTANGPAYGVRVPGEIHAWGAESIVVHSSRERSH